MHGSIDQPQLVNRHNREPIKAIALYMGCRVETAIRRCREGRLAHQLDLSGHYWSSQPAAEAFFSGRRGRQSNAIRRMKLALYGESAGTSLVQRLKNGVGAIKKWGRRIQLSYADITSLTIVTSRMVVQLIAAGSGMRCLIHRRRGSRPAYGENPVTAEPADVRVCSCDGADLPARGVNPGSGTRGLKSGGPGPAGRVREATPMQPTGSSGVSEYV